MKTIEEVKREHVRLARQAIATFSTNPMVRLAVLVNTRRPNAVAEAIERFKTAERRFS